MQFQVPQFIEVEDKIFGPLTLRQFIYMAGGAGISFIMFEFLPIFISLPLILVVLAFSGALAFWKINNKPFINTVESAFKYFFASKLYIWKKVDRRPEVHSAKSAGEAAAAEAEAAKKYAGVMVPKISDSKLKDLAWSLDIKESLYSNKNQR
jgi:hypothetical protein